MFVRLLLAGKWRNVVGCALSVIGFVLQSPAADRVHFDWTEISTNAGGAKGVVQLRTGEILATRTKWRSNETAVVCSISTDLGANWQELSVVAKDVRGSDLGDGHLIQLRDGALLYSYRHNGLRTNAAGLSSEAQPRSTEAPLRFRQYSIRTAISRDKGKTWSPFPIVAESVHEPAKEPDALRGLWSSFLLLKKDGTLQCYYDDEDTPHQKGFHRHQWLTMKTWDAKSQRWINPITVSRAHDAKHLSRDGMPSVVELPSGRLVCVFESVQTFQPHANCVRLVTSDDGGQTWSWQKSERQIVFEPRNKDYLAISPWVSTLADGQLLCVFATDEDRDNPGKAGTPPWALGTDIKCILSRDHGRTWTQDARSIFISTHRAYAPGILQLSNGSLLVTCMDYSVGCDRAFRGSAR